MPFVQCFSLGIGKGDAAASVQRLSITILEILAANHQSRGQLIRGSAALEWSWIPLLTRCAIIPDCWSHDADADSITVTAAQTIQMFGHLSGAKGQVYC